VFNDMLDFMKGLPIKDWGGTVLAAILALAGVVYGSHAKHRMLVEQRALDDVKAKREEVERSRGGDRAYDIAQTQDLTVRFKALMDGYEARIIDLANELKATKIELREARDEIAKLKDRLDAG